MKKSYLSFSLFLFSISFLAGLNVSGQSLPSRDSLIKMIVDFKEQTHVKSFMAGIWKGDQEILTLALGESMTGVPANLDMHLRIGGVSESMFGTLVMILVDQGKIRLDDKISKWLPDLLAADKVTIGMLIKNASGYQDYEKNKDFVEIVVKDPFRQITPDEIIHYATKEGLAYPPGTKQNYTHSDFTILAKVLEKATGKTLPELLEENIFRPLNLNQTGYSFTAELPFPVLHSFSNDRGIYEDATYWSPSWAGSSGPVYSTIKDIGKWSHKFGTGALLTPASYKVLITPFEGAAPPLDPPRPGLNLGSGFVISNGWFSTNPNFNGYYGGYGYLPSKEITIAFYCTQSETSSPDNFAFQLFKKLAARVAPDELINY